MGILSVILGGIIILLINITGYGISSETRSMAINSAQEALDAIKTIRDNEYCDFFSNNGNYTISKSGDIWIMTSSSQWVDVFPSGSNEANATQMQRNINISDIQGVSPSEGKRVTVTLKWTTKGLPPNQTYTTITELYKWKY